MAILSIIEQFSAQLNPSTFQEVQNVLERSLIIDLLLIWFTRKTNLYHAYEHQATAIHINNLHIVEDLIKSLHKIYYRATL